MNPGITEGLSDKQLQKFNTDSIKELLDKYKETKELNENEFNIDGKENLSEEEEIILNKLEKSSTIINNLEEVINVVDDNTKGTLNIQKDISLKKFPINGNSSDINIFLNQSENEQITDNNKFKELFKNIGKNFNIILNSISPTQSLNNVNDNNDLINKTKINFNTAKNILKNDPTKLKQFNIIVNERINYCPGGNQEELLQFANNLNYTNKTNQLQSILQKIENEKGENLYEYLIQKIESDNSCNNKETILLLSNKFHLTDKEIHKLTPILGEIKENYIQKNTIKQIGEILNIEGNNIYIKSELYKLGIDYNLMMKNDNYINDIKNNSNLNEKEKKQIIEILKHSYETNLNAQYLKNVSESDISIYLDKNIKDTESVIEIKNALGEIQIMILNEKSYQKILSNTGIDKNKLSRILSNYEEYNNYINTLTILNEKKELDKNGKEFLKLLLSLKDYIKRAYNIQKNNNIDINEYLKNYNGYGRENKSKLNYINKSNNNKDIQNKSKPIQINSPSKILFNYELNTDNQSPEIKLNTGENIQISQEEAKIVKSNPEAAENLINFYKFFKELNLESIWDYRKELMIAMGNRNINLLDNNSLSKSELLQFGNNLILAINNLCKNNKELNKKPKLFISSSLSGVKNELRKFSGAGSILSDEKTSNIQGEDSFAATLRNFGIIGGSYFEINTLRKQIKGK